MRWLIVENDEVEEVKPVIRPVGRRRFDNEDKEEEPEVRALANPRTIGTPKKNRRRRRLRRSRP